MRLSTIDELQIIANYVKKNPNLIQATGGNVSIKCNNQNMRIKASGQKVIDINKPDGFVDVNHLKIKKFLQCYDFNCLDINNQFIFENNKNTKISIEVYFHAILKRVVLHTHPIELNSLLASSDAFQIIQTITKSINYIPYIKPGLFLGLEVLKLLNNLKENKQDSCIVFYLQNHGLIISAETVDEVIEKSKEIECLILNFLKKSKPKFEIESICNLLNLKEKFFVSRNTYISDLLIKKSYLINYKATNPDTVIFCGPSPFNVNPNEIYNEIKDYITRFKTYPKVYFFETKLYYLAFSQRQADMMEDVFLSHIFILLNCPSNINFISDEQIHDLINRDDEKYRIKLTQ